MKMLMRALQFKAIFRSFSLQHIHTLQHERREYLLSIFSFLFFFEKLCPAMLILYARACLEKGVGKER